MNTTQIKERIDTKILILLIISFLGLILSLSFTLTLLNDYHLNKPGLNLGYTFAHWMTFFTHLSLVLVMTWSLIETINKWFKLEWKLKFLRQTTVSWISLTGLVFFIPWIGLMIRDSAVILSIWELDWTGSTRGTQILYSIVDIIQTTLLHVIIPIFSAYIFIQNSKKNERIAKRDSIKMVLVSMVSIIIYYLYVNIMVLVFIVEAPYIFFDWNNINDSWTVIIMLFVALIIGIIFLLINIFFIRIQKKYSIEL